MRVPDMGSFKDVAVIDVLVKPGDAVEAETPLVTLETEKATMDVPASGAGTIEKIHVEKGAVVNAGDLIVTVSAPETDAAATKAHDTQAAAAPAAAPPPASEEPASPPPAPAATVAASAPSAKAPPATQPAPAARDGDAKPAIGPNGLAVIDEPGFSRAHAGPSVRHLARELGVDLARVTGTGLKGRITHDDVKSHVRKVLTSAPAAAGGNGAPAGQGLPKVHAVDFAAFGPVEIKPLGRIKRISASRLHASWVNLPHVTQYDEADITELEDARGKLKARAAKAGVKLTPLAFIVRACTKVLQQFPDFNASLDEKGENVVYKKYCHIGFAADTPHGLLVPVLRDADRMDIYEIARQLAELAEKARGGKLSAAEMQGGSFTISSLGGIGGTAFTPIINAPEVAILGVSRSSMKPVYKDGGFVPRLMMPLSLSYDHRVVDGAAGARFTTALAQVLADPRGLIEAVP